MIELGLVALLLVALVGVPALFVALPWDATFGLGLVLVALGMGVGVPAGALYHVRLWRALRPAGARWWLNPTGLHGRLDTAARPAVLRWFRVGAAGFLLAMLGCALAFVGAYRGR